MTAAVAASAAKSKLSKAHTADLKRSAKSRDKGTDSDAQTGAADARAGRTREAPFGSDEEAYGWGYDAELDAAKKTRSGSKKTPAKKTPAKKPAAKSRPSRSTSSRRKGVVRRAGAQSRQRIEREATSQIASGLTVLAYATAIAVAYNALTNVKHATGTIGGVVKVVQWLDSTKAIPYGGQK